MTPKDIETRYDVTLPPLYHHLYDAKMLDWLGGHTEPLPEGFDWAKEVYPTLHENPPLLFHTGGDLFLMSPRQIAECGCPEYWDGDRYRLIPFAKGIDEAMHWVFFYDRESGGEPMVATVFEDEEEAEIVAENFEDFIVHTMFEAADEIDKENLDREYGLDAPEKYRVDILRDLETIRPYVKPEYSQALEEIYHGTVGETLVSYYFEGAQAAETLKSSLLDFNRIGEEVEL